LSIESAYANLHPPPLSLLTSWIFTGASTFSSLYLFQLLKDFLSMPYFFEMEHIEGKHPFSNGVSILVVIFDLRCTEPLLRSCLCEGSWLLGVKQCYSSRCQM